MQVPVREASCVCYDDPPRSAASLQTNAPPLRLRRNKAGLTVGGQWCAKGDTPHVSQCRTLLLGAAWGSLADRGVVSTASCKCRRRRPRLHARASPIRLHKADRHRAIESLVDFAPGKVTDGAEAGDSDRLKRRKRMAKKSGALRQQPVQNISHRDWKTKEGGEVGVMEH